MKGIDDGKVTFNRKWQLHGGGGRTIVCLSRHFHQCLSHCFPGMHSTISCQHINKILYHKIVMQLYINYNCYETVIIDPGLLIVHPGPKKYVIMNHIHRLIKQCPNSHHKTMQCPDIELQGEPRPGLL